MAPCRLGIASLSSAAHLRPARRLAARTLSSCPPRLPSPTPSHSSSIVLYFSVLGATALFALDEWLDLRKWKTREHRLTHPLSLRIPITSRLRAGPAESGQGCVDWPSGRVLLQWALEGGVPQRGATVLEIGSGVGLTSIGLALAFAAAPSQPTAPPSRVIASDLCDAALANLRVNARASGFVNAGEGEAHEALLLSGGEAGRRAPPSLLTIERWDAAGGVRSSRLMPHPSAYLYVDSRVRVAWRGTIGRNPSRRRRREV